MKIAKRRLSFVSLCLIVCAFPAATEAIVIQYQVTNLPDTTPGEDRWQYTYTVSDHIFNAGQGFTVFFDHALYQRIQDPPPEVNSDWDVTIWQPDSTIPDAGAYDALSITSKTNGASLTETFAIQFIWVGNDEPGPQPFEVYQEEPFFVLEAGDTQSESNTSPWDVNGDGMVNIFDLVLVGGAFGQTPPADLATDVNGDGVVNIFDLVLVGSHFGEASAPAAAPLALTLRPRSLPREMRVSVVK